MEINRLLKYLPQFIRNLIDPYNLKIQYFVETAAQEISEDQFVLDAGAGECRFKNLFTKHHYVGVDSCVGDIRWDYLNLNVVCNLLKLPFKSHVYKAALCVQVLEHVNEPEAVLREVLRVLKPGGIIYLSAPQGWGVHQPPHDYFRFTSYGLKYLMEKAGFEVLSIKPAGGYYNYLANRLTVLPKTLFWQIQNKALRIALIPLECLSYVCFVLVLPFILNSIDFLDTKRDYTLNYLVKGKKPGTGSKS